ncbi:GNAT family N-acetyltransferase [Streptomyces paromomycinus]|uniref:GCN5 family N-acetyltransferase n=1 Tax=Streptomyces paromomycinus TaxID=92743 RepID=A0A401VY86_STREY|nr:GNAT family N-acetyltransferase [Streptomyces paromomycinus]GCD42027.1 GCN5 family N-acetyltransferase [Streptomyces paromomycinus]
MNVMETCPVVRPAVPDDLPLLRDIERAAGEAFRAVGMEPIADDEPPSLPELARYQEAGRALVVCTAPGGAPLAYLLWEPVDGCAHIEQVSVHPDSARRGLGQALIERAWRDSRLPSVTLTTFADVPWNAPYYARLGFRVLDEAGLTQGLRAIRRREAELGLDRWERVCMRRDG